MEHGEYKENLYGTSLEAIRSVMAKKKVCLVDVVPEVSSTAYFKDSKYFLLGCKLELLMLVTVCGYLPCKEQ